MFEDYFCPGGSLATIEVGLTFHSALRGLKHRVNIGFYHEQREPGGMSEINED